MNWKWFLIFILLLILVIFATQNYEVIKIQFLIWSFASSTAIVILTVFFIGIIVGWVSSYLKKNGGKLKKFRKYLTIKNNYVVLTLNIEYIK